MQPYSLLCTQKNGAAPHKNEISHFLANDAFFSFKVDVIEISWVFAYYTIFLAPPEYHTPVASPQLQPPDPHNLMT